MASALSTFGLTEMLRCSMGVRQAVRGIPTMESAARSLCEFLYRELVDDEGAPACALIRVYKTHAFGDLDWALRRFAERMLEPGTIPQSTMRCLTLLATIGSKPAWNDRRSSRGHQAIPLPTAEMVERAPMVAQLIRAFGLNLATAIAPEESVVRDLAGKTYGVFHVPEARESEFIPAQDFVRGNEIRSVVGFGGALSSGDLFAVILFSRVPISAGSADRFRTIALDIKSSWFGYRIEETFDSDPIESATT